MGRYLAFWLHFGLLVSALWFSKQPIKIMLKFATLAPLQLCVSLWSAITHLMWAILSDGLDVMNTSQLSTLKPRCQCRHAQRACTTWGDNRKRRRERSSCMKPHTKSVNHPMCNYFRSYTTNLLMKVTLTCSVNYKHWASRT